MSYVRFPSDLFHTSYVFLLISIIKGRIPSSSAPVLSCLRSIISSIWTKLEQIVATGVKSGSGFSHKSSKPSAFLSISIYFQIHPMSSRIINKGWIQCMFAVTGSYRLPLPGCLLTMFPEELDPQTEDRSLHGGRIRSFKHERGNWATYVYLPCEYFFH